MIHAVSALHWLEQMPAPDMVTHDAQQAHLKVRLNTALPLNNRTDADFLKSGLQLAPLRRISGYDVNPDGDDLVIRYVWHLPESQTAPLEELNELAARVSYFGRAEDRVEMAFSLTCDMPAIPGGQVRWNPCDGCRGVKLAIPRPYSLRDLGARHDLKVPARIRKANSLSCLRLQAYERHDTHALANPAFVSIVSLSGSGGNVRAFDPLFASKYRAWLRGALIRTAREEIHWMDRAFALEIISGHLPDGRPTKCPHLAVVPLPSLHQSGLADGQVRRFALLGFAPSDADRQSAAADVFRTLIRSINGKPLVHDGRQTDLVIEVSSNDRVWQQFASTSRVWNTAFPIKLKSKFDVSRALSDNERHIRRQQELQRLIRRALSVQGLPASVADYTAVTTSATPFIPKTERVEKYLTDGTGFLSHARLVFPCPVAGPLVIGDGRYSGMGLCFPQL
jgi:CRISPR-associated protein Csb2